MKAVWWYSLNDRSYATPDGNNLSAVWSIICEMHFLCIGLVTPVDSSYVINTARLEPNDHNFANDNIKCISWMKTIAYCTEVCPLVTAKSLLVQSKTKHNKTRRVYNSWDVLYLSKHDYSQTCISPLWVWHLKYFYTSPYPNRIFHIKSE